jgi:hypothetical protein
MNNSENVQLPENKIDDTEQTRRDFLNKFGKLAMITPVAMTALMSPSTSAAPKSCTGNGRKKCR